MQFYHIIKLIILNWELSHMKNINQKCDEKHSGKNGYDSAMRKIRK